MFHKMILSSPILSPGGDPHPNGYDTEDGNLIVTQNMQIPDGNGDFYTIIKPLGNGHFSDCYAALYSRTNKPFALKIMLSSVTSEFDTEALARTETNISQELEESMDLMDRKYLHTTAPAFTYQNHIILISEILGDNLYTVLQNRKYVGLNNRHILMVAHMVTEALSVLHSRDILHCDIKPENIALARPSSSNAVKLIDLGGAIHLSECMEKQTAFSLFYRPPEVILGYKCCKASDVWSLGATLFEMFVGLPFFPCSTELELLNAITHFFGPLPNDMIRNAPLRDKFYSGTVLKPHHFNCFFKEELTLAQIFSKTRPFEKGELELFTNFFEGLLALDPNSRLTVEQILNHPIFNSYQDPYPNPS